MIDSFGAGDGFTACLAAIVVVGAIVAVWYLLHSTHVDDERLESGGMS